MTSPSSALMRAISTSMWAVNHAASSPLALPPSARSTISCAPLWQALRVRSGGAVVGCDRPHLLEEGAPLLYGVHERAVIHDVYPGCLRELLYVLPPAGGGKVRQRVWSESGAHPVSPALVPKRRVVLEGVGSGVRGAEHLDLEALEERPRRVLGARESLLQVVVQPLRALPGWLLGYAEHVDQLFGEPKTGGGTAEEVEVLAETLPDLAVVTLHRRAVEGRDAEVLHCYPLAVEHPADVVVGDDE
jgi:hypothetical protein